MPLCRTVFLESRSVPQKNEVHKERRGRQGSGPAEPSSHTPAPVAMATVDPPGATTRRSGERGCALPLTYGWPGTGSAALPRKPCTSPGPGSAFHFRRLINAVLQPVLHQRGKLDRRAKDRTAALHATEPNGRAVHARNVHWTATQRCSRGSTSSLISTEPRSMHCADAKLSASQCGSRHCLGLTPSRLPNVMAFLLSSR